MNPNTDPEAVPTVAFPPTERRSLLFDLSLAQVLVLGPAISLALLSVFLLRSALGLLVAAVFLGPA